MKKIFLYVLILFVLVVGISLYMFDSKDNKELDKKLKELDYVDKKLDYFKYINIDRYIDYRKKNPTLDIIDIITRVNLNLDYPFYSHTIISNFLNRSNILVNKYIYLPSDYIPNNLEIVDNKYTDGNKLLVSDARINFEEMAMDAKKEDLNIRIISAYRDYNYQKNLYDNYVLKDGKDIADTYSARPGYSEHQTGLVIDLDNISLSYEQFESTDEFKWMEENSYKYGYILRYPLDKEYITGYYYEPWHYRYVGKRIAKYIHDNDITFDEYYVRFIEK